MRGEYIAQSNGACRILELPPRARRIRNLHQPGAFATGTTSACAENTTISRGVHLIPGNYLRVRGEYAFCRGKVCLSVELPPRARRIPMKIFVFVSPWGNYLRVRGEYKHLLTILLTERELPPRARRILAMETMCTDNPGTTSACAENTISSS